MTMKLSAALIMTAYKRGPRILSKGPNNIIHRNSCQTIFALTSLLDHGGLGSTRGQIFILVYIYIGSAKSLRTMQFPCLSVELPLIWRPFKSFPYYSSYCFQRASRFRIMHLSHSSRKKDLRNGRCSQSVGC